ncbi:threonine ammonia-lyase, biosynthetic [Candidatus Thioglobus sp.]|uniref:threonine ammonia-lyase, biosynthetic n=1 Tax=Candidatus Thioglobus sp. TaxID=2026721 RepID=UPI003D109A25
MQSIVSRIRRDVVREVVKQTPLEFSSQISASLDNKIYLKREDLTAVHSFKLRGAYHKIRTLSPEQLAKGVVTCSAGNHAQGVAFSAKKLGISATIVMPKITPKIKIDSVKSWGAEVILFGNTYDEAYDFSQNVAKQKGCSFIHAFDDLDVIAGQGTIAYELLEQLNDIDYIFIPVGGGGLITGIASVIKTERPEIKIIGVEPIGSDALTQSIKANTHAVLSEVDIFAEGVAVKKVGFENLRIVKDLVDDTILVSNDEMCAAIKDIYNQNRQVVEPSGALALAGLKRYVADKKLHGKNIISIVSGANMNFDRLRYVAERADIGEQNEAIIAATIDEKPGSFLKFCQMLEDHSITEFNYRYASADKARIFVGVSLSEGLSEKKQLLEKLSNSFDVLDMSDNSIAKTHIRYMVGGRSNCSDEVLYRFEFPERPQALLNFLKKIGNQWNITLFHYRNHGADFGRVLIGLQAQDIIKLEKNFDDLGYFYQNETDNKAYQYFL